MIIFVIISESFSNKFGHELLWLVGEVLEDHSPVGGL